MSDTASNQPRFGSSSSSSERVLVALALLERRARGTRLWPAVDNLMAALAADTTVADLRQEIALAEAALEEARRD